MVRRPLEGLRVLDLTRFVAGSQTTALLAAFGADVVKLEVPPGGDPYRVQGTERLGDQSVLFLSLNSGKRSLALDFRSPSAAEAVEPVARLLALRRGELATRQPRALRPGLGDRPRAIPLDRVRLDLWLRRRRARRRPWRLRPDPPGRERRDERDRQRRVGAGEGRCPRPRRRRRACAARSGCSPPTSSGRRPAWERTCRPRSWSSRWPRWGRSPPARSSRGTCRACSAPTHRRSHRTGASARRTAGSSLRGRARRTCGCAAARVLGAGHLREDPRFADNASRVRHRDELTAAFEEILRKEPSAHWLDAARCRGGARRGGPGRRPGVRGRAGACARRRAGAPFRDRRRLSGRRTAGAVRSGGVPVPVARARARRAHVRASWPSSDMNGPMWTGCWPRGWRSHRERRHRDRRAPNDRDRPGARPDGGRGGARGRRPVVVGA